MSHPENHWPLDHLDHLVEALREPGVSEREAEELAATLGVSLGELGGDEHDSPAPRDPA